MVDSTAGNRTPDSSQRGWLWPIVEAMRPGHWIKNSFVVAPVLFSMRFVEPLACVQALVAGGAFCLLSSGVYLLNDVCDRQADRAHPVKRRRPVASGRLSPSVAAAAGILLMIAGITVAVGMSLPLRSDQPLYGSALILWAGCYLVLNLLYSFWLKAHMIIDVIVIALGFVLRAMAGAAAISVPVSPWLVVCTFTLCLFIALTKRRGEIAALPPESAAAARATNRAYEPGDIEHMLTVSAALAILTYALYCLAPGTVSRVGSAHLVWTIPIVVYGMFRYNRITRNASDYDPVSVMLRDRIMWIVLVGYVVWTGLILTYGGHPSVAGIVDVNILVG